MESSRCRAKTAAERLPARSLFPMVGRQEDRHLCALSNPCVSPSREKQLPSPAFALPFASVKIVAPAHGCNLKSNGSRSALAGTTLTPLSGTVTWLEEILLTFPRQGVEWRKHVARKGNRKGIPAYSRGRPRRARAEVIEQLKDGPHTDHDSLERQGHPWRSSPLLLRISIIADRGRSTAPSRGDLPAPPFSSTSIPQAYFSFFCSCPPVPARATRLPLKLPHFREDRVC